MTGKSTIIHVFIVTIIGILLFVPFIGNVHLFDWDEINFAEAAREMLVTNDFANVKIDYLPFHEKPPLFIWMQAISMDMFGINEFAARFPNALCGIITLVLVFLMGKKLYDIRFGYLWVISFIGAILPFIYFKSGIIDPWFNLFVFISIYFLINYSTYKTGKYFYVIASALFAGLAVLTKGPAAIIIIFLTFIIVVILNFGTHIIRWKYLLTFTIVVIISGCSWFFIQYINGDVTAIHNFTEYQIRLFTTEDSGHGGPFYYHFIVLLLGVFPVSIYAIKGIFTTDIDEQYSKNYKRWMCALLLSVLIIFSITKTKIVHYSSLAYFPLTFLAVFSVYKTGNNSARYSPLITFLVVLFGIIWAALIAGLQFIPIYKKEILSYFNITDSFTIACLNANVVWSQKEYLIGIFLGVCLLLYIVITQWNYLWAFIFICIATLITTYSSLIVFLPKIEQYTQNAPVEFYKSLSQKDCYVTTIGFKSYSHLFYSNKLPVVNKDSYNTSWLLNGKIDKPAYFVVKNNNYKKLISENTELQVLKERNGFVFLKRNYKKSENYDRK